jgi:uncharacterized protein YjbJ (UPF0337 family)
MNASTHSVPDARKIIVTEIIARWGKFSENELAALEGRDDLVVKLQAKYNLDKLRAERDIDALLKGRPF